MGKSIRRKVRKNNSYRRQSRKTSRAKKSMKRRRFRGGMSPEEQEVYWTNRLEVRTAENIQRAWRNMKQRQEFDKANERAKKNKRKRKRNQLMGMGGALAVVVLGVVVAKLMGK